MSEFAVGFEARTTLTATGAARSDALFRSRGPWGNACPARSGAPLVVIGDRSHRGGHASRAGAARWPAISREGRHGRASPS